MKLALGVCSLLLLVPGAFAQNNSPMSVSAEEHGPGDRVTLFVTFQEPMPVVANISCVFSLATPPQPDQKLLPGTGLYCAGVQKDSDTQYRAFLQVPDNIMTGEYTLRTVAVNVGGVGKSYSGQDLPSVLSLKVKNPKQDPKFAPLKNLKVQ